MEWTKREWRKGFRDSNTDNLFKEFYYKGGQRNRMVAGDRSRVKRRIFKMRDLSACFFTNRNNPVEKRKLIRVREDLFLFYFIKLFGVILVNMNI